eukprot:SAG11_NODE_17855_length_507_cov_0.916667_1_plen_168_part_11
MCTERQIEAVARFAHADFEKKMGEDAESAVAHYIIQNDLVKAVESAASSVDRMEDMIEDLLRDSDDLAISEEAAQIVSENTISIVETIVGSELFEEFLPSKLVDDAADGMWQSSAERLAEAIESAAASFKNESQLEEAGGVPGMIRLIAEGSFVLSRTKSTKSESLDI